MKGQILDFRVKQNQGIIIGEDGNYYNFSQEQWQSDKNPEKSMPVIFTPEQSQALSVHADEDFAKMLSGYPGVYRSSDDKVFAGVCAGLAHKWHISKNGLRFLTVIVTLLLSGIPLLVYIALWIAAPERPTK